MSAAEPIIYNGAGRVLNGRECVTLNVFERGAIATPEEFTQWLELQKPVADRRFDWNRERARAVPRYLLTGKSICTPGNLTTIIAQAKAGKSAFIGAMIAARFAGSHEADLLGLSVPKDPTGALVVIDTEQTPEDHDDGRRRDLRRAGLDHDPVELHSYALAGMSAGHLRETFKAILGMAALDTVFAAIVDGVADLVNDVNDAEEVNAFVAELHGLAIRFNCPIICVVHENPGQDSGKARGHLGSQLERKAESNLRLKKSDEVTVVYSERMRRAPILEKDGPRFRWSDEHGMHVSCETIASSKDAAKRERLLEQAECAFLSAGSHALSWTGIRGAIEKSEGLGPSGAGKRFEAMKGAGVIRKDSVGMWRLAK